MTTVKTCNIGNSMSGGQKIVTAAVNFSTAVRRRQVILGKTLQNILEYIDLNEFELISRNRGQTIEK